jgi:hypothetical protein
MFIEVNLFSKLKLQRKKEYISYDKYTFSYIYDFQDKEIGEKAPALLRNAYI